MATTSILDSIEAIKKIDTKNALSSIEQIGNQMQQVWGLASELAIPAEYKKASKIVVAGMGGSVLGTDVIQSVFKQELQVPVFIAPDYEMPGFVDDTTLVIAASYSGNTEETLAAFTAAQEKTQLLAAVTSGGKLAEICQETAIPAIVFPTDHNPSNCARMGLGYSVFGQMALLAKIGIISLDENQYQNLLTIVAEQHLGLSVGVSQNKNIAKLLAFELIERTPIITVAEHLEGVGHIFANQLHENAKTFAEYRVIPELHHHLLESLSHPDTFHSQAHWLLVESELYQTQNQKRFKLTTDLLKTKNSNYLNHTLKGKTKLEQAFELLILAAYTAFYLAMLYNENPIPNPNVDWVKENL